MPGRAATAVVPRTRVEQEMRTDRYGDLLGQSLVMAELKAEIERISRSDAKVLITGESGVGKELVARSIHQQSLRAQRAFIPVNCAGMPETLLESELFGHVRGSFTGAYRDKPGKLELADGGTLLLDELGEMTLRMQGMFLRFLETGELQKVGADHAGQPVDVRVIAATNNDLTRLIAEGRFREDLFYRLNVIHLVVPPLRERREDVPPLIERFLKRFTSESGSLVRGLAPETIETLTAYNWPGNVRELENVIERLAVTGRREILQREDLPEALRSRRAVAMPTEDTSAGSVVANDLYHRLTENNESFWTTVYPLYMRREITRTHMRDLVRKGLEETRGNYKIVVRLFNMDPADYKRFLNFLRKHDCQLPFQDYRQPGPISEGGRA
jgi:transcriptional regulator with PAS, ATPase and Fis domain